MFQRNLARVFLITTVIIFVVFTFSPAIATTLWRIRHRGQIKYAGASFETPDGWFARVSPAALHFEKRPLTVFSHSPLVAWATVAPVGNPPHSTSEREEFYSNFAALYSTKLALADEIEEQPIRLGTGDREAFCMQSVLKDRTDWLRTTCLIRGGTWRASFEGGPKEKEQFFAQVLGLPDPRPK